MTCADAADEESMPGEATAAREGAAAGGAAGAADEATIRVAEPADAEALLAVYAPYVTDTAITFEYEVPDAREFTGRIERTLRRYPYLVAQDVAGRALGYAYLGAFNPRAAYDWSAETSIYLAPDARGRGLGGRLYRALEGCARAMGILTLDACVAVPAGEDDAHLTRNSARFHAHLGYVQCGCFHSCGYKFGTWYDMVWMEKRLAPAPGRPSPVTPFPQLTADTLAALGVLPARR